MILFVNVRGVRMFNVLTSKLKVWKKTKPTALKPIAKNAEW